jgi:release factor glutamine methyltransferase
MTIKQILRKTQLKYEISPLDSGILLSLAIKKSKEYLIANPENKLSDSDAKKYFSFVRRRLRGEPIAYLAGHKEFFGLKFSVNKYVLIPRPETELLVEKTLSKINKFILSSATINLTIIDIGTGSGNIIISIAKNIPKKIQNKINFYATDISNESLRVVKANAKMHGVEKKIKFIKSDLLEYFLKRKIKFKNVFVIANLPYVSSKIYQRNKFNLKYEPKGALVSNKDGLDHHERLIGEIRDICRRCNAKHVACYMEISPEQKAQIGSIIKKILPNWSFVFHKDLAGRWRAVEIKRR